MNWRKKAFRIAVATAAAGAIAGLQAGAAAAQSHAVKHIFLAAGNPGSTLASGYTTVDQENIWCYFTTCTFAMSIMANVGDATCRDQWAIVGLVDGNSVDGAPLVGTLPQSGSTDTSMWQGVYAVKGGDHTLTFQIYLPCSANANQWSVRYLLTTP